MTNTECGTLPRLGDIIQLGKDGVENLKWICIECSLKFNLDVTRAIPLQGSQTGTVQEYGVDPRGWHVIGHIDARNEALLHLGRYDLLELP